MKIIYSLIIMLLISGCSNTIIIQDKYGYPALDKELTMQTPIKDMSLIVNISRIARVSKFEVKPEFYDINTEYSIPKNNTEILAMGLSILNKKNESYKVVLITHKQKEDDNSWNRKKEDVYFGDDSSKVFYFNLPKEYGKYKILITISRGDIEIFQLGYFCYQIN